MEEIAMLSPAEQEEALRDIDPESLLWDWSMFGRPEQIPPADNSWDIGLFLAGRGAGKTRSAAEWIREKARFTNQGQLRFLLVARTAADARQVLITGEALALDTPVATPDGFTPIGELKVGDRVIGGDGLVCTVTKAYPVLHNRPTYSMDIGGTTVVADANHKWVTSTKNERMYEGRRPKVYESIRTTEDIFDTQISGRQSNHAIRVSVVQGVHDDTLPIGPYTLGMWLGDGTAKSGDITSHPIDAPHIRRFIEAEGYTTKDRKDPYTFGVKTLTTLIKSAGVFQNKHIPEVYFHTSTHQRMELLRGLIDSDGCIGTRGDVEFSNTNLTLIQDVARLAASLGLKPSALSVREAGRPIGTTEYVGSEGYRFTFATGQHVASLPRKSERIRPPRSEHGWRSVRAVQRIESVPVRCIEVDSPDHTFLITNSYIKTHNSGILNVTPPSERPEYKSSVRELVWPNGNRAFITTADEPDSLRGPQAHYSWGDEIAAWRLTPDKAGMTAWDNLRVATRLGRNPQIMATTTPKRVPILFDLLEEEKKTGRVWLTRGSTYDNAGNLGSAYMTSMEQRFGSGSNQARQELFGEMLDAIDGALWTDELIKKARYMSLKPPFTPLRVIGVDPSVAENPRDLCGIVVCGSTAEPDLYRRQAWVIEDLSLRGSPTAWAEVVVDAARRWQCPVVAETNQGGALVRGAINQIDPSIQVLEVHASVGKKLRAEPVTLAYEQGRVHHLNVLGDLETEMTTWMPETSSKSPDRLDALVHALTALLIKPPQGFHGGGLQAKSMSHRRFNAGPTGSRNSGRSGRGGGFRVR